MSIIKEKITATQEAFIAMIEQMFRLLLSTTNVKKLNRSVYENSFENMYPTKKIVEDIFAINSDIKRSANVIVTDYGSGLGNVLYTAYHLFDQIKLMTNLKHKKKVIGLHGYEKHAAVILKSQHLLSLIPLKEKVINYLSLTNINRNVDDTNRKVPAGVVHIVFCNKPFLVDKVEGDKLNHNLYAYIVNSYPKGTYFVFPNHMGFLRSSQGIRLINNHIAKKQENGKLF